MKPWYNEMNHPVPPAPAQSPNPTPNQNEDDHAEKKEKENTCINAKQVMDYKNFNYHILWNFTCCRFAPYAPKSPTCCDIASADIIVNSFTFKLLDLVLPVKLTIFFQKKKILIL